MTIFLLETRWIVRKFLAASSPFHILLILAVFVPIRLYLSLKHGMVLASDGAVETGTLLGRFWMGQVTFEQFAEPDGAAGHFLRERSSQLLYPLLISLHKLVGMEIETYILVLNTALGATLLVASYMVALRLRGKAYAVLVTLLMCSLTPLYWLARWAVVDNLFYAVVPLFALSVVNWRLDTNRRGKSLALMVLGFIALLLTRPESSLVIASVLLVLAWPLLRRYGSTRALATGLFLLGATVAAGTIWIVSSSPSLQKKLLSRAHISWGLELSATTLFNRGGVEFDRVQNRYSDLVRARGMTTEEMSYLMGRDAIAVIKGNPFLYLLRIPVRGLATMFPWSYQPWSLPHILYEAAYTIFLAAGLWLLFRRGIPLAALPVLAIPLSILMFLSAYGIDNDLKHRNGILVGLNLIAPLGYFLKRETGENISDG